MSARALKVATPATAATLALETVKPPDVKVALTVEVLVVTMLPPASSIFKTGCWASAAPLGAADEGSVTITSFEAPPADTVIVEETAAVSPPSVNVSVYVPAEPVRSRPLKVATPATATAVALATDDPTGGAVMAAVTVEVFERTTLLLASSTLTTGWTTRATPLGSLVDGWVVMTSLVAGPETTTAFDTAAVSELSVNVSV